MANGDATEVAQALAQDLGSGAGFQKSGITYNEKVRSYTEGIAETIMDTAIDKYKRDNAERRKEEREQEASDKLRGQVLESTQQELPEDASDVTKQTYRASQFIRNSSKLAKEAILSFDSNDFMEMGEDRQNENVQAIKDGVIDSVAGTGIEDLPSIQGYLIEQMKAIDIGVANSRHNYKNVVLPTRTVGNTVDMLIEQGADEAQFEAGIKQFYDESIRGSMPTADMDRLVYGEIMRATESGNLDAFPALKKTETYKNLSSSQKTMLDRSYEREITQNKNQRIDELTKSFRSGINHALATGDLTPVNEMEAQLQALPAAYSEPIRAKLDTSLKKLQPTREALQLGFIRASGERDVDLDDKQTATFYDYTVRENMNMGGGEVPAQEAKQMSGMQLANIGLFTENTHDAFDLQNVSFVDGQMDIRSARALQGGNNLHNSGLPRRDIERVMGDKNYAIWTQARTYQEQGFDSNVAISRAIENNTRYEDSSEFEKAQAKVSEIDVVQQAGWFDIALDAFGDVAAAVVPLPTAFQSQFELEQSEELELFTQAPLGETGASIGDAQTAGALSAIGESNTGKVAAAFMEFQDKYPSLDSRTRQKEFTRKLEEDTIIANGNVIMNDRLGDRLRGLTGSQTLGNKYLSLSSQALTPMMTLPREERIAIQDTIMNVQVKQEDGSFKTITDQDEKIRVFNAQQFRKTENVQISVDLEKYDDLYSNGGTLSNGRQIKSLRNRITKLAGWFDTRSFGQEFIQHKLDYDENTRSFLMEGLDRSGEILTTDMPVLGQEVTATGEVQETVELAPDTPVRGAIPEDLMMLFVKAYAVRGE